MASEKKMAMNEEQMEDDEVIVVMTDDEGNEYYYAQELILQVDGDKYALLVPTCADDEEEDCHCHEHEHEDDDEDAAFFAKIVLDESGEEEYITPTDEEFEAVVAAYEALMEEEDEE